MLCERCQKPLSLCICDHLQVFDNRLRVLILQHPQEPDKELGTALISHLILKNSVLATGLSWAKLSHALGAEADARQWLVLFLGSTYKFEQLVQSQAQSAIHFFDKLGDLVPKDVSSIQGIVAIDGTWAQAKALWWRNPWLLKLNRAVVMPSQPSLYGNLRREPRRECLSTIESIANTLEVLGDDIAISKHMIASFRRLLQKYRDAKKPKQV